MLGICAEGVWYGLRKLMRFHERDRESNQEDVSHMRGLELLVTGVWVFGWSSRRIREDGFRRTRLDDTSSGFVKVTQGYATMITDPDSG